MSGDANDNSARIRSTEAPQADPPRPSFGTLLTRLVEEGEAFVRAEVNLYRAQAMRKAFSAGFIVALVGGAIMLTQALIVVILMGIVLVIAPSVGIGWAVVIVALGTVLLIAGCVLLGRSRVSALLKPEESK